MSEGYYRQNERDDAAGYGCLATIAVAILLTCVIIALMFSVAV